MLVLLQFVICPWLGVSARDASLPSLSLGTQTALIVTRNKSDCSRSDREEEKRHVWAVLLYLVLSAQKFTLAGPVCE
jgi:hypothetical protein